MSQSANAEVDRYESDSKAIFGFWLYIMTDCVLFAGLFAVYAVLHKNVNGGLPASQLFSLPYVLAETLILLTSSFTCGLGMLAAHRLDVRQVIAWFRVTMFLGAAFLVLEIHEFIKLAGDGNTPQRSGFLSSYFTLVGTHGLHITIGLLWMGILLFKVKKLGLNQSNIKRLTLLSLFWHFLDLIWIFIFTIVYLLGALGV